MKLYYYIDPKGNFGDDLNPWLWQRLIPEVLNDDPSSLLVGIGSILDHRIPSAPIKHVLGGGVGYGKLPNVDEKFVFHAVRGPMTASALGLKNELAITDAAVLVRRVVPFQSEFKQYDFGFMTTGHSEYHYDWERLCQELGFRFISCHWPVEKVIKEINSCKTLISEAMHGAIVADTLRVPWIPVALDKTVLPFKWKDWLSTLNLPYDPTFIASLYDNKRIASASGRFKNLIKHSLKNNGIWQSHWGQPFPLSSDTTQRERACEQLDSLRTKQPYLSDEDLIESLTVKYEDVLEKLKRLQN